METRYTEHDSDRVREAEFSSAGKGTQPLGVPAQPHVLPRGRNNGAAVTLIVVGVILLGLRMASADSFSMGLADDFEWRGGFFFLLISSVFLFFAQWKHMYGLLIPGCILGGMAVGVTLAGAFGPLFLWGLALGFAAIYVLGRLLMNVNHFWPLIPASVLFAVGLLGVVMEAPGFLAAPFFLLPLLLIGAGFVLGVAKRRGV